MQEIDKNEECIIINVCSKCKNQIPICFNIINKYDNCESKEKICFGKKDDCYILINVITKCRKNENPVEINVIAE